MGVKTAKEFWVSPERGENPGLPGAADEQAWDRSRQVEYLKHKTPIRPKHKRGRD